MLTRIYADNYRCMVNFECALGAKQLILGPNGAGKSTLFDVVALLRDFCVRGEPPDREPPAARFVGRTRTRWQDIPEQAFELDVSGNGGTYRLRLVMDAWGYPEKPRVMQEEVTFSGKPISVSRKGRCISSTIATRIRFNTRSTGIGRPLQRSPNVPTTRNSPG